MKCRSLTSGRAAEFLCSIMFNTILLLSILSSGSFSVFSQDSSRLESPQAVTELSMTSDAGDYIGGGQNYYFAGGVGAYTLRAGDQSGDGIVDFVDINFNGANQYWTLDFSTKLAGRNLVPGFYDNAMRYPFESGNRPGLSIYGNSRGCNQLAGSYTIHEAEFDYTSAPPRVSKFAATFEQHCEGLTPAFYGTIYYNYTPSTAQTYAISGQLTDYTGAPAANTSVGLYGSQTKTTVTDAAGNYSFTGLLAEGNYRVAPSSAGYILNPTNSLFRRLSSNQTANFTVVPLYSLSGRVVNEAGSPVTGASIRLSGSQTLTATTDNDGRYSFTNLRADGNYTVTPSRTYYTFNPGFHTFSTLAGNSTADFVGAISRYSISGRIINSFGTGVGNVRVELRGSNLTTTDANGIYTFENVLAGGNYEITPINAAYYFSPAVQYIYSLDRSYSSQLFTANTGSTYLITGIALDSRGNALGSVLITISGSTSNSATTDANGFYTFRNLPAGGNYTITPQKKGYVFAPLNRTINNLAANSYANFVGIYQTGKGMRASVAFYHKSEENNSIWRLGNDALQFGLRSDKPVQISFFLDEE